jgi:hypothetical protein
MRTSNKGTRRRALMKKTCENACLAKIRLKDEYKNAFMLLLFGEKNAQ